jgi:hypothetical protein
MSSMWIHAPLLQRRDGETATSHRKELLRRDVKPKTIQTGMRLTCGSPVVVCVGGHLKLFSAARGPLETGFEPR